MKSQWSFVPGVLGLFFKLSGLQEIGDPFDNKMPTTRSKRKAAPTASSGRPKRWSTLATSGVTCSQGAASNIPTDVVSQIVAKITREVPSQLVLLLPLSTPTNSVQTSSAQFQPGLEVPVCSLGFPAPIVSSSVKDVPHHLTDFKLNSIVDWMKPKTIQEEEENQKNEINILSFDGGGSKGVMEVFILKDVFKCLTILQRDSAQLEFLMHQETSLNTEDGRKKLRHLLDNCQEPIHPTEAFDFIVGTSVGSLIAFGLVGGKKTEQERTSMEVEEIIQMFKDYTKTMFDTKAETGWISWIKGKLEGIFLPFPAIPYSQEGLEKILIERFGDLYLAGFPRPHDCVAGAVAKKIYRDTGVAGDVVLFTTRGLNDMYKVVDVLKASSAAPIYFETPAMIGDEAYIDGGDGGNCPLAQALEAIPEIFGEQAKVVSVLSIAPPRTVIGPVPEEKQWKYWLNYFPFQVTDGTAVYDHVTKIQRHINCQRLFPKSDEAKKFKLDEKNVEAMISCMEKEAIEDKSYFIDIIQAALKINIRLDKCSKNEVRLQLCQQLFESCSTNPISNPNQPLEIAHLWLEMAERDCANSSDIARIKQELADCYFDLDQYDKAVRYYKESLNDAGQELQPNNKAILNNRIGTCYKSKGYYDKAKEYFKENERMIINQEIISPCQVAETYFNLSDCDLELEKFNEAIENCNKSLVWLEEQKKKSQSHEIPEEISNAIALSYNGLGNCYLKWGEFAKAGQYYEKGISSIHLAVQGVRSNDTLMLIARIFNDAAICLMMNGKHDKAFQHFQTSLEIKKKVSGRNVSGKIAISHTNFGNCYMKKREYDKAIERYNKSLGIETSIFERNAATSNMAEIHNNLGICFVRQRKERDEPLDKALSHFEKSLEIKKKLFGRETAHRSVAKTYNNLGRLYMEKNQYREAIAKHNKSLEMKIKLYGDDRSILSIRVSYQNLGEYYLAIGDEEKARSYFEKIKKVDDEELLEGDFC